MKMKILLLLASVLTLSACKEVPKAYRGNFIDAKAGVKLTLKAGKGTMTLLDGTEIKTKAETMKFEDLVAGQAGLYVDVSAGSKAQVDWIIPDVNTKQEFGGLVYYVSKIIITDLDLRISGKAERLQMMACMNGQLLIDTVTKTYQIGCGSDAMDLSFERVKK